MTTVLLLLQLASVVMLMLGLIKPELVIFWGKNKTRKDVLKVYLSLAVVFFIAVAIFGKTGTAVDNDKKNWFTGVIEYSATVTGSNTQGVKLFESMAASVYTVYFYDSLFCQSENKGLNFGRVVLNRNTLKGFFIDGYTEVAEPVRAVDMDALDEKARIFAPQFYNLQLEKTSETDTICGYITRKYRIAQGGAIRPNARAFIWVCHEVTVPPSRFMFENENKKFPAPVPLFTGLENGLVMKMEVVENDVNVVFTVTRIDPVFDHSIFQIPANVLSDTLPQISMR